MGAPTQPRDRLADARRLVELANEARLLAFDAGFDISFEAISGYGDALRHGSAIVRTVAPEARRRAACRRKTADRHTGDAALFHSALAAIYDRAAEILEAHAQLERPPAENTGADTGSQTEHADDERSAGRGGTVAARWTPEAQ